MLDSSKSTIPLTALFGLLLSQPLLGEQPEQTDAADSLALPEISVVSGRQRAASDDPASASVIAPEDIQRVNHSHAAEMFSRSPGIWVTRGSGQEHLTAIRSPVLTGAGACGAFLFLEDNVPIRPTGFCNVNNLFEINLLQANSVELMRGPGNALYGSNAQHGLINAISARPFLETDRQIGLDIASNDFQRLRLNTGASGDSSAWRLKAQASDAGSFRADEGYNQQKLNFAHDRISDSGEWMLRLAATRLDQQTAGFILGEDAYRDQRRFENLNPEAFRRAEAQRMILGWNSTESGDRQWQVRGWLRRSDMQFRMHFLPGKPLEENDQHSIGSSIRRTQTTDWGQWISGADVEWARGTLFQAQETPTTEGSEFLRATRPQGRHYDFSVDSQLLAAWSRAEWWLGDWRLSAGLRAETLAYDYDNRMADGNLREDGSACGFGGCIYNRPGDRRDRFTTISPELGVLYADAPGRQWFARLADGYRAPQVNELYRLQRGQEAADIDNEQLLSMEVGRRWFGNGYQLAITAYHKSKRNVIFQDAQGLVVDDGRTRHRGFELEAFRQFSEQWAGSATATLSRHSFDRERDAGAGERIERGNQLPSAPGRLFDARLHYQPGAHSEWTLHWQQVGNHWLDAANSNDYPGHDLLHLMLRQRLSERLSARLRISNLLDQRYAERADFAFGNYRYFPGAGREWRLALDWQL